MVSHALFLCLIVVGGTHSLFRTTVYCNSKTTHRSRQAKSVSECHGVPHARTLPSITVSQTANTQPLPSCPLTCIFFCRNVLVEIEFESDAVKKNVAEWQDIVRELLGLVGEACAAVLGVCADESPGECWN